MAIVRGMISPHPPIMVPEVGGEEVKKISSTVKAMEKLASEIKELDPEVLIFITPHGTVFQDAVAVTTVPRFTGSLSQFGADEVTFDYDNDMELAQEIINATLDKDIDIAALDENLSRDFGVSVQLDHGIMVPLYFLKQAGVSCSIVPISMGLLPFEELYNFGIAIREGIEAKGRRAVIVASGDLSHRLTREAPAGYHPRGQEFDDLLVALLKNKDIEGIMELNSDLIECAGECGLRPFIIALGIFDGREIDIDVLSYEGPFGVGYLVADIIVGSQNTERELVNKLFDKRQKGIEKMRKDESAPVALARRTLEKYVTTGEEVVPPSDVTGVLNETAGVFVSIKKHGQLRGCIGTIEPTQPNVANEIIHNAISAGTRDPRFNPVTDEELNDLTYSVDILYPPEPISGMEELDPKKYGVIVRSGYKSGLLLPNLEGIDTVEEQVDIALKKAGINKGEPVDMERFEVVRYY